MNLVFNKLSTKNVSLISIIRLFHSNKNISMKYKGSNKLTLIEFFINFFIIFFFYFFLHYNYKYIYK